jgi:hypothetical protein
MINDNNIDEYINDNNIDETPKKNLNFLRVTKKVSETKCSNNSRMIE